MHEMALPSLGLYRRTVRTNARRSLSQTPNRSHRTYSYSLASPWSHLCPRLVSAGSEMVRVVDWSLNLKLHGVAEGALVVRCEFHPVTLSILPETLDSTTCFRLETTLTLSSKVSGRQKTFVINQPLITAHVLQLLGPKSPPDTRTSRSINPVLDTNGQTNVRLVSQRRPSFAVTPTKQFKHQQTQQ
jgi:hypothetical protein